ncbi:MAG TPA: molybdate ABC transporter substrate-binding protein [Gaiellaceae bacterium]|nr:molybdate ABC transporter substrate-binding protein [Gaiellaceae bacterium]
MGFLAAVHLTVFAAASLTNVFPKIASSPSYSFGGSNMLAAQIEQGAPADVFASADTKLPAQLHAKGACGTPVVFTRNAVVIVVPRSNPGHIRSVTDLTRRGVKIDVAATGVPVGNYTTKVLRTLHLLGAVTKNIVSRETDVRSVLSKVALGEADAGFVYSTDAKTVAGKVTVITLPARAQPNVRYAACVVATTHHRSTAQAFVHGLLRSSAQAKLRAAGFLSLP